MSNKDHLNFEKINPGVIICNQNPSNLQSKINYPIKVRATLLFSICIIIILCYLFPKPFARKRIFHEVKHVDIEQFDIPMTEQLEKPPPPSRPSIPVASESEDLADDITIDEVLFEEFEEWESPPPLPSSSTGPKVRFIPYDEPPVPIGGYAAIQSKVIYPEIAMEAGIDGTVIVQAFINKSGIVLETVILSGAPNTGLDEAAVEAVKNTQFKPAKQRDKPIGVWISIPIHFRLMEKG